MLAFWVLVADGDPIGGVREFYDRSFAMQLHRASPFSLLVLAHWAALYSAAER